jgi:predicted MFS family arabinose efflux permease
LSFFGAAVIAMRVLVAWKGESLTRPVIIGGSLALLGTALCLLALAASSAVAIMGAVVMGAGFAPLFPALTSWCAERLHGPGHLGTGLTIFGSFTTIGFAAGSLAAGTMIDRLGSTPAFLVMGACQLAAAAAFGALSRTRQQSDKRTGHSTQKKGTP